VSWESNGVLKATGMAPGSLCTVEWTHRLDQSFTSEPIDFEGIAVDGNGTMTMEIPMFFRVRVLPEGMVKIPGGTNNGINPLAEGESPGIYYSETYSLTNETFYMDQFEITKAQWDAVRTWAVLNGYIFAEGQVKEAGHPVHMVNWYDCVKWCNARSEMEGRTPCYTVEGGSIYKSGTSTPDCNFGVNGFRLPTGDEWEYAARGGLKSRRFPWGDTITHSQANYYSDSFYDYDISSSRGVHFAYGDGTQPFTSPVGSFSANGYGLYDMAGNIQEWCWDLTGLDRLCLGGEWGYYANLARCGQVYGRDPVEKGIHSGFRTVCR